MKRNLARTTLGIVFFAALVSLAPAAQANGCTMSDVAGKWGYTCTGTIILTAGAIPAAAVGRFALDAIGNISGTQIRNVGGSVAAETIKGTGTVNADCTATYKVDVYDGGETCSARRSWPAYLSITRRSFARCLRHSFCPMAQAFRR